MELRRWLHIALLALAALLVVLVPDAGADPGDLDTAFAPLLGYYTAPFTTQNVGEPGNQAIALDSQQRVLVATSLRTGPNESLVVFRLTPSGALDTSFNAAGPSPGMVKVDFSNVL